MARPIKNNCDYFPHDGGMRNHRKIKAIISKFGLEGYAYWNIFLEILTTSENFTIKIINEIDWELLSAELHTSNERLKEFITYLITLSLIKNENNFYWSESLIEMFQSVLNKRISAKNAFERGKEIEEKIGKKIQSTNGINRARRLEVFERYNFICAKCGEKNSSILDVHHITPKHKGGSDDLINLTLLCPNCHRKEHIGHVSVTEIEFSDTDKPQSKVEYSKVNKSIFIKPSLEEIKKYCLDRKNNVDPEKWIDHYISNGWMVGKTKMKDWQASVRTWEKNKTNNKKQSINSKWE